MGRRLACMIAAIMLLAGCNGSSSGAGSVQTPSQPASSPALAPPPPGSQAEFDAYLKKVLPPRLKGNHAIDQANKAYDHLNSTPDSTWDEAAVVSRHTAGLLRRIADRMSAIVPPQGLGHAHLAYAAGWRTDALIYGAIAHVLRGHQFLNWDIYNARFDRDQQTVTAYRAALIAYAARHGLKVPHWVHTIGGK